MASEETSKMHHRIASILHGQDAVVAYNAIVNVLVTSILGFYPRDLKGALQDVDELMPLLRQAVEREHKRMYGQLSQAELDAYEKL